MLLNRRNFAKTLGIATVGVVMPKMSFGTPPSVIKSSNSKMKLSFKPYELQMEHTFTVAEYSRNSTPDVLTQIEYEGITGYGEASMPPYLGESIATVTTFLQKVNLEQFSDPFRIDDILDYVDSIAEGNPAAKASVDIALHDLIGKIVNQPLYKLWGLNPANTPYTDFTIGIDKPDIVRQKTEEAKKAKQGFKVLKVKLGRGNDQEMINTVRKVTDIPLYVDVNQGWKDKNKALDMIYWLKEKGVVFVEQPMPKTQVDDMAWLTQYSPLPTMADEAFQRLPDIVNKIKGVYSGINIKLMKSTGLYEAQKMITVARALDMKVMVGCMTETSCGVSAVAQLSPLVDWGDLDGNLLIKNDPFTGMKVIDGKVTLKDWPGIGIKKV
ncbi:L-alanine-DL-glutamate epimerase (EC 5.1.1.n1) [hydrothermal vent metagenome]|uniref:L-alanine-DL-glutamate epimerase n=1 Tax=hydrothermal vent metagenome TaxID=652676 RepID=A0A3B0UD41_9ZZZZ